MKEIIWKPVAENEEFKIKNDIIVQAIRKNQVKAGPGIAKSLSYKVYQTKTKLKPENSHLSEEKIRELSAKQGKENITTEIRTNIITYSGDTPVDDYEKWHNPKILVHEATFLNGEDGNKINIHRNKHSNLNEVIKMVSEITVEKLILGHFSSRYSAEQIDREIKRLCNEYKIKIPVYRVLPGQTHRNILNENAINQ